MLKATTRFVVLSLIVQQAAVYAADSDYKFIGQKSSEGTFQNRYYRFSFSSPNRIYDGSKWEVYVDRREKRSTVLLIGLRGYDTYVIAILRADATARDASASQVASQRYPSATFTPAEKNSACVTTDPKTPIGLTSDTVGFMAICIDQNDRSIYEVSLSYSIRLQSFEQLLKEADECNKHGPPPWAQRCPDHIEKFRASYSSLINSLVFSTD